MLDAFYNSTRHDATLKAALRGLCNALYEAVTNTVTKLTLMDVRSDVSLLVSRVEDRKLYKGVKVVDYTPLKAYASYPNPLTGLRRALSPVVWGGLQHLTLRFVDEVYIDGRSFALAMKKAVGLRTLTMVWGRATILYDFEACSSLRDELVAAVNNDSDFLMSRPKLGKTVRHLTLRIPYFLEQCKLVKNLTRLESLVLDTVLSAEKLASFLRALPGPMELRSLCITGPRYCEPIHMREYSDVFGRFSCLQKLHMHRVQVEKGWWQRHANIPDVHVVECDATNSDSEWSDSSDSDDDAGW
jgi:hypothetical protein